MSRPIQWFRLYRGRVWHVHAGEETAWAIALCGQPVEQGTENLAAEPPRGGKPCPECLAVAGGIEDAGLVALAVWRARHYTGDDLVDSEIVEIPGEVQ
jgi:hypothetical protein